MFILKAKAVIELVDDALANDDQLAWGDGSATLAWDEGSFEADQLQAALDAYLSKHLDVDDAAFQPTSMLLTVTSCAEWLDDVTVINEYHCTWVLRDGDAAQIAAGELSV